jgi:hypothetical protein
MIQFLCYILQDIKNLLYFILYFRYDLPKLENLVSFKHGRFWPKSKENPMEKWLIASNVGSEYHRHAQALAKAAEMPVGAAFMLPVGVYELRALKRLSLASCGQNPLVVIEHAECLEVRKLEPGGSPALFYDMLDGKFYNKGVSKTILKVNESGESAIISFLKRYFAPDYLVKKYDEWGEQLRAKQMISYSAISRNCSAISIFRKKTEKVYDCVNGLIEKGILQSIANTGTEYKGRAFWVDISKFD